MDVSSGFSQRKLGRHLSADRGYKEIAIDSGSSSVISPIESKLGSGFMSALAMQRSISR